MPLSDAKLSAIAKANEGRRTKCWEQRVIKKEIQLNEQLKRRKEKLLQKVEADLLAKEVKLMKKAMQCNSGEMKLHFEITATKGELRKFSKVRAYFTLFISDEWSCNIF